MFSESLGPFSDGNGKLKFSDRKERVKVTFCSKSSNSTASEIVSDKVLRSLISSVASIMAYITSYSINA